MKNLLLFVFIILIATLSGCKKSDDSSMVTTEVKIDKSANLLTTGDSANDILSNVKFDKLLVEIAYVKGFQPENDAMNGFMDFLKKHTFKQTIEMVYKELPSPELDSLELQKIAELELENRTAFNTDNTVAIYIYFADAPSADDDEDEDLVTLGAVYRNTSMVIFESTVRKLAGRSSLISNADAELATLNHEFGHLFGLVNLGTDQVRKHEDEEAKNHCNVEGCLMRAELQFNRISAKKTSNIFAKNELHNSCRLNGKTVLSMLQGNASKGFVEIPPLDVECIADLAANGGK